MCDRWAKDVATFVADMGPKPPNSSIDRIDNNGNYEPGNCRWATMGQQMNNRRSNRFLTFRGKSQTVVQWSEELGMNAMALYARLKYGWSDSRILSTPINHYVRKEHVSPPPS